MVHIEVFPFTDAAAKEGADSFLEIPMLRILAALATATLGVAPAFALVPPREESPAPRELVQAPATGSSDAEIAAAIAAAARFPLGTARNPVRVGGPEGARAYLGRLRCANGAAPTVGARAAAGIGAYGAVVAAYPVDCGAAAPGKVDLVMDIYQAENAETQPPQGFVIEAR